MIRYIHCKLNEFSFNSSLWIGIGIICNWCYFLLQPILVTHLVYNPRNLIFELETVSFTVWQKLETWFCCTVQWTIYSATTFLERCRKVVQEIWFKKSGSRNLVQKIWFEKSGLRKMVVQTWIFFLVREKCLTRKKVGFIQ